MYEFVLLDRENNKHVLRYDPHVSTLTNEDGSDVLGDILPVKYKDFPTISKDKPGTKGDIEVLKISLGLKCNYSCLYCVQATYVEDAVDTNNDDAKSFMENLSKWLRGTPKRIELWGGEPFVYWSKLKIIVPLLREKFPDAIFSMHTNGSLLDNEKIDFIEKYDIVICLSHDGPNQKFRGPDPFNNPKIAAAIHNLFTLRPTKTSFNIVLHSKNYDFDSIAEWFQSRVPGAVMSIEGIVDTYDSYTLNYLGKFTKAQLIELCDNVFKEIVNHGDRFPSLALKTKDFIISLKNKRPLTAVGQKCGMDRSDRISVDLEGNVSTCQNTGMEDHKIGHVNDYDNITLNTATHFSFREECMSCPLVQLCKGSCMFLEDDLFAQSCWNEYYFNMGFLKAALYLMTGAALISVNGDILRPEFSKEHLKKFPALNELYT